MNRTFVSLRDADERRRDVSAHKSARGMRSPLSANVRRRKPSVETALSRRGPPSRDEAVGASPLFSPQDSRPAAFERAACAASLTCQPILVHTYLYTGAGRTAGHRPTTCLVDWHPRRPSSSSCRTPEIPAVAR